MTRALYHWLAILDSGWILIVGVLVAVSAAYFFFSRHLTRPTRVVTSAHGILFALALLYVAGSASAFPSAAWTPYPFVALLGLGIASVALSVWNLRKTVLLHAVHVLTLSYAFIVFYRGAEVFDASAQHTESCWLPVLGLDIPSNVPVHVGDRKDRSSDYCPVPVARTIEVPRPYGHLEFEFWGSPHRLYMVGELEDGSALQFLGNQVAPYSSKSASWLSRYSHRRTFLSEGLSGPLEPVAFSIAVLDSRGATLDELALTYRVQLCACRGGD